MVSFGRKLPYIIAAITLVNASKIKGIAPEKQSLYQPLSDGTWKCLDNSKVILYSAINDDYCDCLDGSDEPGTSACPNGIFYCENKGHIPSYIKSFSINDGVCDEACCDGTDESSGQCPNRCQIIGEKYREEQKTREISTREGLKLKNQWIKEAKSKVDSWQEEKAKLEGEIVVKKSEVIKLEHELKALESQSQETKISCPSYDEEISTLKNDVTILRDELETLTNILGDMKRDHNHNFHDMAVKSAISGYDEFMERYDQIKSDIDEDIKDVDSKVSKFEHNDTENGKNIEQVDKKSTKNTIIEKLDSILPETLKTNVLDKWLPKKVDSEEIVQYEGDIDKLREKFEEAESELDRLNRELDSVDEELSFDYGTEKEWLQLKDVCIEKDEGEYTYSLCFLGDAYQKSNKDSTRTHLGKFKKFDGGEENIYKKHVHAQGTRCWNGPERSVKAAIECGIKNEILEVSEPEKCEYLYRVVSPAVCQEGSLKDSKKPTHEEL